jgi:hypothetical protein
MNSLRCTSQPHRNSLSSDCLSRPWHDLRAGRRLNGPSLDRRVVLQRCTALDGERVARHCEPSSGLLLFSFPES